VLGLYGGADAGIPNDTVAKMNAALKSGGQAIEHTSVSRHAACISCRLPARAIVSIQALDGWFALPAAFPRATA
jgi:hypothetical protein